MTQNVELDATPHYGPCGQAFKFGSAHTPSPWSKALPHGFAGMSPDTDRETSSEASHTEFDLLDVHSNHNGIPLSSESGSQPDDDLIHPAKRPRKGRAPRAVALWSHARSPLPHEPSRAPSGHRWFYCSRCDWESITSNARRRVASYGIHIGQDDSLQKQAAARSIKASFSAQELAAQARSDEKTRNTLRNACNKGSFRNAVARFVTSQSLAHNVVESREFHAMCLTLNCEAGHALVRSHSSIPRRIASNFKYQRSLVKDALHEAQSAIQLCTDSWTSGLTNQREFQAINAQWGDANGQIQRALLALPELT